jgi:hypothetical protein
MLHNIFVRLKDEWEFEASDDDSSSDDDSDEDGGRENSQDCTGVDFQDAIRDRWLAANGWVHDDE